MWRCAEEECLELVEYDSGLDAVFSKVQLKAVTGVFGAN